MDSAVRTVGYPVKPTVRTTNDTKMDEIFYQTPTEKNLTTQLFRSAENELFKDGNKISSLTEIYSHFKDLVSLQKINCYSDAELMQ